MTQKIYLSRHGMTDHNRECANGNDVSHLAEARLIETGISQAIDLGKYLNSIIPSTDHVLFLLSDLKRTHETAHTVAYQMNRTIEDNLTSVVCTSDLNESIPLEFFAEPDLKKYPRAWDIWKKREDFGINARYLNSPHSLSIDEIALQGIYTISEIVKHHSEKTVIAILHEFLNFCMLERLRGVLDGITVTKMENCSLYVFERNDNILKVSVPYISRAEIKDTVNKL